MLKYVDSICGNIYFIVFIVVKQVRIGLGCGGSVGLTMTF